MCKRWITLSELFGDIGMVWQTIEYDLNKSITEVEFTSLYGDVDYMIQLFEKYITIGENNKFVFDEYDISKDDLQQLLNTIIQDYQKKKMVEEAIELDNNQDAEIHK